jgi:LmbE family N-acetylglucosaminyl deacetylase
VVSFDAREPGTRAASWEADGRLQGLRELDCEGHGGLLVLAAHPDDETLGAGGLLARFAERGLPIRVVVVTSGSPEGDAAAERRRENELARALELLAPRAAITLWRFPDAATGDHRDELRQRLTELFADTPSDWLVAAPWAGDGHHDHRVVGELVAETAGEHEVVAYPIWMWHWAAPDDAEVPWPLLVSNPVDADLKRRALERYPSQTAGADPLLRPELLEHFVRDREFFVTDRIPEDYFEAGYARRDDPWGFEDRWYERRKRAVTLAALPEERYARGLEIGCSIGVLTAELADRVDDLLATDVSAAAVERARRRVAGRARVEQADAARGLPPGPFDLIVLSEVGYYLTPGPLGRLLDAAVEALADDGVLVCCHWRHPVADYPLSGDAVHERIRALGLPVVVEHVEEDFVLEVLRRDPRSVATRTGLA